VEHIPDEAGNGEENGEGEPLDPDEGELGDGEMD
jgi:hypothetical protein